MHANKIFHFKYDLFLCFSFYNILKKYVIFLKVLVFCMKRAMRKKCKNVNVTFDTLIDKNKTLKTFLSSLSHLRPLRFNYFVLYIFTYIPNSLSLQPLFSPTVSW